MPKPPTATITTHTTLAKSLKLVESVLSIQLFRSLQTWKTMFQLYFPHLSPHITLCHCLASLPLVSSIMFSNTYSLFSLFLEHIVSLLLLSYFNRSRLASWSWLLQLFHSSLNKIYRASTHKITHSALQNWLLNRWAVNLFCIVHLHIHVDPNAFFCSFLNARVHSY